MQNAQLQFRAALTFEFDLDETKDAYEKTVVIPCTAVNCAGGCWFDQGDFLDYFMPPEADWLAESEKYRGIFFDEDQVYCDGEIGPLPAIDRCLGFEAKNGDIVWENDIIGAGITLVPHLVFWDADDLQWMMRNIYRNENYVLNVCSKPFVRTVLGNAHQNPDLLHARKINE